MTRRLFLCGLSLSLTSLLACSGSAPAAPLKELQRARSGGLDVVLLSDDDAVRQGQDSFVLEFRRTDGELADPGSVKANATMTMAGMGPMLGGLDVRPSDVKGRYTVSSDLSMAGTWRFTVEWDGPEGKGSVSLPGTVR